MTLPGSIAGAAILAVVSVWAVGCGPKEEAAPAVGTASLTWSAVSDSDLAGYKVYIGASTDTFESLIRVGNTAALGSPISVGNTTTFQVTNLPIGQTYKFAVTAVDTSNNESGFSNETTKFIGSVGAGGPSLSGTTYYTAKTGSDSNSCAQAANEATPKLTINAGILCLSAGDTLIVKAGLYEESFADPFFNTGSSWASKISVKGEAPLGSVMIRPPSGGRDVAISLQSFSQKYIEFSGIVVDAVNITAFAVRIWGAAHHIRFKDSSVLNGSDQGVSILKDAGASPDFNEFINVEVAFIAMNSDGTTRVCTGNRPSPAMDGFCHGFYIDSDHNVLDGVRVHHNNGNGVQFLLNGNRSNTIRNSRSHDNHSLGIVSFGDDNKIINNVIFNNGFGGIWIRLTNALVFNNTIYNNPQQFDGLTDEGVGSVIMNNLLFQNGARTLGGGALPLDPTNLIGTDPLFVDAAAGDFRLSFGSPAIDAGTALPEVPRAIDGIPRPQGVAPDIGAFEFSAASGDIIPPAAPMDLAAF